MRTNIFHVFFQICLPSVILVTAATPQVWRAVRQDREKVRTSPALREYATMTKQVWSEKLKRAEDLKLLQGFFKHNSVLSLVFIPCFCFHLLQEMTQTPITVPKTRRRMEQTVVWTAGRTLRRTLSARVKRRKGRARVYAPIR